VDELTQLKEEKKRLEKILDFGHKISTQILDLDELLKLLMQEVREILNADRCTVFIRDFEKDILWSRIADGLADKKITLPVGKGIVGAVAKEGKILNIKDAYADERFNRETDKKTGYCTKTILSCPLKNKDGEVIGVFQVLNKKNGVFDEEDEKILTLLARQAADAIENAFLYEEQRKMFESFIETLSVALDRRDTITAGHSKRVTYFSIKLGEKLNLSKKELELLKYASWMHDLGKIGVREAILTKNGRLTDEEYEAIKKHAVFTKEILEKIYFKKEFREIPLIASSHHENYDGTGYPLKISGTQIPFLARIIAICDVFDAITSHRHYRKPMPILKVLSIFKEEKGKKFDATCVDAFFKISLYDIITGINLDKVQNFVILEDDKKVLAQYTLEDLWRFLKGDFPTPSQKEVVNVFLKYYGK